MRIVIIICFVSNGDISVCAYILSLIFYHPVLLLWTFAFRTLSRSITVSFQMGEMLHCLPVFYDAWRYQFWFCWRFSIHSMGGRVPLVLHPSATAASSSFLFCAVFCSHSAVRCFSFGPGMCSHVFGKLVRDFGLCWAVMAPCSILASIAHLLLLFTSRTGCSPDARGCNSRKLM